MKTIISDSEFYKNRELSWLQFELRVLNEAKDTDNLLFERLKFLSITGSNLDEFFMIRVASLKDMVHADFKEPDIAGYTPLEQLELVSKEAHNLSCMQMQVLKDELLPELKENGIVLVNSLEELTDSQKQIAKHHFKSDIFPVLTPMVINEEKPFPLIRNKYLYVGGFIRKEGGRKQFAMVQIPSGLERVVVLSKDEGNVVCILIEDIIKSEFNNMFSGYEISNLVTFRVMRNADLSLEEEGAIDLLSKIKEQVEKREWGEPIRLEISGKDSDDVKKLLLNKLSILEPDCYKVDGPIDLTFLLEIYSFEGFEKLRKTPYTPVMPWEFDSSKSLMEQINEHDLMLIHPFESFAPVVDFINEAAMDPDVLAIKQTLYRVSGNSPIVEALAKAARNGKQVTVLVELKARFDEENNISVTKMLERAGCQVIYGYANLKTHCKITLVIRKEAEGIKRYMHLGTGNYNDATAKLYTDISFFTAKDDFGEDASNVFNMLSGLPEPDEWHKLSLAPNHLRNKFLELIEREAVHAENNEPAHIIAKMNSLCDKEIIEALYDASCRGVSIELIVRGICCLKAGVPGVSENITVRSIVGNFLEHSRIYYFKNGGNREYYCSSADWMARNMDKRVEILFPVERKRLCEKLSHVLKLMLMDNRKAWILQPDGSYMKMPDADELYCFQEGFFEEEIETENSVNKNK